MIAFACPACKRNLSVKDDFAGKRGNCPHCKKTVVVPVAHAPGSPQSLADAATAAAAPDDTPSSSDAGEAKLDFLAKPQAADELGRLGQYRVLKVLGTGGMGMVLLADDPILKRKVALKVMRPEVAADKNARKRFLREAQATAALDHHHIISIHQVGQENGVPYIVMPLLKGEPLDARLKRETRLPIADVVTIAKQTAEGLAEAHQAGLVHRDIKPANIWLQSEAHGSQSVGYPRVKILDFGLARGGGEDLHLTKTGAILGTPAYMAPEQAKSQNVDFRCDLFSLGAVMYRMLTGELPFKGHDAMSMLMALATETPKPVQALNPEVPPALGKLVMQMLAKDPEQRPASAKAVAEALGALAGETTILTSGSPLAGRASDGTKEPSLARPANKALRVLGSAVWSLRPWAFRRPGLAFALEAVVFLLFLLLILLPFASRKPDQKSRDRQGAETTGPPKEFTNSLKMKFMVIPAGKFTMGSSPQEIERALKLVGDKAWEKGFIPTEGPEHQVVITKPFYLGATEVSVGQFRKFVNEKKYNVGDDRWQKPGWEQTDEHPVVWVSWNNAVDFCMWLSQKEGRNYRLPTEAEWEYSCRAGTKTRYSFGDNEGDLLNYAWINTNSGGRTHPVKELKPNAWGLYDMHGNAWEWCQDVYAGNYYKTSPKQDPPGPSAGGERVLRGGSWDRAAVHCRSAFRDRLGPGYRYNGDIGFRVLLVSSPGGVRP